MLKYFKFFIASILSVLGIIFLFNFLNINVHASVDDKALWGVIPDTTTETGTAYLVDKLYVCDDSTATVRIKLDGGEGLIRGTSMYFSPIIGDSPTMIDGVQITDYNLRLSTSSDSTKGRLYFPDGSYMASASTSSPTGLSSYGDINIEYDSDNNGSGSAIWKSGPTQTMILNNDGNLGIGWANPTAKLYVYGGNNIYNYSTTGIFYRDVYCQGGTGTYVLNERKIGPSGAFVQLLLRGNGGYIIDNQSTLPTGYILLQTSGTARAIITNAGNMGIGSISPTAKLDVNGNIKSTEIFTSTIQARGAGGLYILDDAGTGINGMFLADGGNLGVGTTDPTSKLEVNGDITADSYIMPDGTVMTSTTTLTIWVKDGSDISYSLGNVGIANSSPDGLFEIGEGTFTVLANGNVGIGTTQPGATLEINGDILVQETTRHCMVGPADFTPLLTTTDYPFYTIGTTNDYLICTPTSQTYFIAPARVPDGATITNLEYKCYRDDALATLSMSLKRRAYGGLASADLLANLSPSGTSGAETVSTSSISYDTVDNSTYLYFILIYFDNNDSSGDTKSGNIDVTYTITSLLP